MAQIIYLPHYDSESGVLTVLEKIFPTDIKRLFFIKNVGTNKRGGHKHYKSTNALVCINGTCKVEINLNNNTEIYHLDDDQKCLIIPPDEFRTMFEFSENAILIVVSDTNYDENDYIYN